MIEGLACICVVPNTYWDLNHSPRLLRYAGSQRQQFLKTQQSKKSKLSKKLFLNCSLYRTRLRINWIKSLRHFIPIKISSPQTMISILKLELANNVTESQLKLANNEPVMIERAFAVLLKRSVFISLTHLTCTPSLSLSLTHTHAFTHTFSQEKL